MVGPGVLVGDAVRAALEGSSSTGAAIVAQSGHVVGLLSEKEYVAGLVHGASLPRFLTVEQLMQTHLGVAAPHTRAVSVLHFM